MSDEAPPTQIFPNQIIFEILTRLPVKTFFQFKVVSQNWNSLISTPHFINTYISRAPPNWLILDRVLRVSLTESTHFLLNPPPRVSFLTVSPPISFPVNPTIEKFPVVISASNGLILVASTFPRDPYKETEENPEFFSARTEQDSLFVINPVTRECTPLPNPSSPINHRGGIGFSTRINELTRVIERFIVVEYRPLVGSEYASLLCFSSETWEWVVVMGVYMLNDRMWRSDGAFEIDGRLFWFDLSVGIIFSNDDVEPFGVRKRGNKGVEFGFVGLPEGCECGFNTLGLEETRRNMCAVYGGGVG